MPGWMPGSFWNISQEKAGRIILHTEKNGVTEETAERYLELISRRAGHIPLQHLTHQAFFMGYEFYVNENVLVPRQDTETLVELGLECYENPGKSSYS